MRRRAGVTSPVPTQHACACAALGASEPAVAISAAAISGSRDLDDRHRGVIDCPLEFHLDLPFPGHEQIKRIGDEHAATLVRDLDGLRRAMTVRRHPGKYFDSDPVDWLTATVGERQLAN